MTGELTPGNVTVTVLPVNRVAHVPVGTSLHDAIQEAGVVLALPCGGQGRCGRCLVIVRGGRVRRRSVARDAEARHAVDRLYGSRDSVMVHWDPAHRLLIGRAHVEGVLRQIGQFAGAVAVEQQIHFAPTDQFERRVRLEAHQTTDRRVRPIAEQTVGLLPRLRGGAIECDKSHRPIVAHDRSVQEEVIPPRHRVIAPRDEVGDAHLC